MIASKGKPVIMSTGMATLAEIEEAVTAVKRQGNQNVALLRCASAYPAITDEMNLRTMQNMEKLLMCQWDCLIILWVLWEQ